MKPGQPERIDYEYERGGTANLFMLFASLEGFRHIEVTDHRKTIDYTIVLKDLSDIHFPRAKKIALVQDNLNTHAKASLYAAFAPAEGALHAQTWQLAEHGGIRVGRSSFAMPGPAYLGQRNTEQGSCCLAKQPK